MFKPKEIIISFSFIADIQNPIIKKNEYSIRLKSIDMLNKS